MSEKARSPPRITRPAFPMPSLRLAATEPTPAIAKTPSAMQAMKTPKPRSPPRKSRQANRQAKRPAKPAVHPAAGGADSTERELSDTVMRARSPNSRFHRHTRLDVSPAHVQDAIAARRECGIVRDQNQRGAALAVAPEQKLDNLASGRFVEIAGRFVGDGNGRIGRQGTGEGESLLVGS